MNFTFVSVLNTTYDVTLCCRECIEDENRRGGVEVERTPAGDRGSIPGRDRPKS